MEDFLGLKVLWPEAGVKLGKVLHDIVLVHGLHSGPISDWQDEGGLFWPVELLGHDLENTRILSFGYHTNKPTVRSDDACEEGRIFNHGEALCSDLYDNYKLLPKSSPSITFIGHGTGGIVIKSALSYSHARNSQYGLILRKTKHVIFLDTPHEGLNAGAWRSLSRGTFSEKSIGQWELWSSVLSDLRKVFGEIATGFNITSSCASLRPNGFADDVAPGDTGLTFLRHERTLHLDGVKHLTICKFSERNNNYQRLLDRIRAGRVCITKDDEQIQKVRSWIGMAVGGQAESHSELNTNDHERCLNQRHDGTCEWLFSNTVFSDWVTKEDANRILWLTAPGGSGKSVLCSVAVQQISQTPMRPATPYLMVTYRKERSKCQMATLLASQLLDHVLAEQGGIDTEVLSLLNQNATKASNIHDLIRLLVSQCSAAYFFLDGLDEIRFLETASSSACQVADMLREDLLITLQFLASMAWDASGTKVRLWCSSQKADPVNGWMMQLKPVELIADETSIEQDIHQYLAHTQDNILVRLSDPADKAAVTAALHIQAGCNFRWASMMGNSLTNTKIPKDLVDKVLQGLPKSLRESYQMHFKELKRLDKNDQEEGNPPISMDILSILMFAKRPLKVGEVQEALSIHQMKITEGNCPNLDSDTLILKQDIMHRCAPLVDFVSSPEKSADGHLQLSHASVYEFLQEHMAKRVDKCDNASGSVPEILVCHDTIADACLKYLSQVRYSKILRKLSATEFETGFERCPDNIRQHHFLQYAAKYWYRHLEEWGCDRCEDMKAFISSPQFITSIQVQSLFVVGHFINSFDHENKSRKLMKRNIPEWFRNCTDGRCLVKDYEIFITEWSRYLQLGVTDFMNGEIERCLWGALGPRNFLGVLGRSIEQNQSFLLAGADAERECERERDDCQRCVYNTISEDGTRLSVWKASPDCSNVSATSNVRLERELWYIDGSRAPFQYGPTETISFDPSLAQWDLYDPCHFRDFLLIPAQDSPIRVPAIADSQHGIGLRIGSAFFTRAQERQWTIEERGSGGKSLPYWEDVFIQGHYTVRSRRKLVKPEKVIKPADGSAGNGRRKKEKRSSPLTSDEDDSDESDILDEQEREELISSAEEYWSVDSSASASSSEKELKRKDSSADEESAGHSGGEDELQSDSNSEIGHDTEDPSSSLSLRSNKSSSAVESVTSASSVGDSDIDHSDGESDADDEKSDIARYDSDSEFSGIFKFQPKIARSRTFQFRACDLCREYCGLDGDPLPFYQCRLCNAEGWDMCSACFGKGEWCPKNYHQLVKMIGRKNRFVTIGTACRNDARPGVNITVQRNRLSGPETVFRYTTASPTLLYESPPVLHPTLPLLVFPLDGRRFLFANLLENTYLTYHISFDEAESKGSEVSAVKVALRFSNCGRYLHIGRVSAKMLEGSTPTVKLFNQVLTVELSTKNPSSRRPKTLPRRHGISLGIWPAVAISQLPFTFTWEENHVYISLSGEWLRVYKIPLTVRQDPPIRNDTPSISKYFPDLRLKDEVEEEIQTLDKKVALPRSARVRPIHFYPPRSRNECAKIIIGAMYGERPQLPIVVYLKPQNMGEWVVAKEAVLSLTEEPRKREDPLLEDFDVDSDCDLIMPLLDFQR
ncbi:uncharacterized protein PAC_01633 [Phialocephala subalpina]|uniref:Nephrocystin 3-like N-terminal domain-containing protein n=1 Tax=Phialocephala subalpina TaxID=576137 RepID=A0A1L7WG50_9HELO|nr:uncharacterized protein PAC_01633 [Phialocephala subalpina]